MVNQDLRRSFITAPRINNGFEDPRNYDPSIQLNKKNGKRVWYDSFALEHQQIIDFETFRNKVQLTKTKPQDRYKTIRHCPVFDVKHYKKDKASLVFDSTLTKITLEFVYSVLSVL